MDNIISPQAFEDAYPTDLIQPNNRLLKYTRLSVYPMVVATV